MQQTTDPATDELLQKLTTVAEVFSPGAPINRKELFSGRRLQITDVINAVYQRGQHVILFGERGVGKTSLANVIREFSKVRDGDNIEISLINCDKNDDFQSLWKKVFTEVYFAASRNGIGFVGQEFQETYSLGDFLSEQATPEMIRLLLQQLGKKVLIIIDEFDRIEDKKTTALMADTIKTLSDHSTETTVILVGVADSVDELIEEHISIERCLVQVQMPRMSYQELCEVVENGLRLVGMEIKKLVASQIALLSQGFPNYTHLLTLHAAQSAIARGQDVIMSEDLTSALQHALRKTQQSITNAYYKATASSRETIHKQVLLACAFAKPDSLGFFAAADVRTPMSKIMGRPYDINGFSTHLNDFSSPSKGNILQRRGARRSYRYRFSNPLMQPHVIINGLANHLLTLEQLEDLQNS